VWHIAGVWSYARRDGTTRVELEPFGDLPAWARGQLATEARRLAAFLDG
jgi:hypothetical protein